MRRGGQEQTQLPVEERLDPYQGETQTAAMGMYLLTPPNHAER